MLFDKESQWIGYKILNEGYDGNRITLPNISQINFLPYQLKFVNSEEYIELLFDNYSRINKVVEQECNIDISNQDIFGIEILLFSKNIFGKKDIIKPFIKWDI